MVENMKDTWDYRIIRKESKDGSDEWYSVQELYYDDETGEPMAQTIDLMIEGDTVTGMRTQLELMLKALKEPVLDESDITDTKNDWICEICGKDTSNVEYDYIGSGTNHLGCELKIELKDKENKVHPDLMLEDEGCSTQRLIPRKKSYIYESPDGGNTLYRREFGDYDTPREKVTKEEWQKDVDNKWNNEKGL